MWSAAANNSFSGTLPADFGKWRNATQFYGYSNKLTGVVTVDVLQHACLTQQMQVCTDASTPSGANPGWPRPGTLPRAWASMVKLKYLEFNDNRITGAAAAGHTFKLFVLTALASDPESGLPEPASCKTVTWLCAGTLPQEFAAMSELRHLYLANNFIRG